MTLAQSAMSTRWMVARTLSTHAKAAAKDRSVSQSEHVARALRKAREAAARQQIHPAAAGQAAQSVADSQNQPSFATKLVTPLATYFAGLLHLYKGTSHVLNLWLETQQNGPIKERHDIRHVIRTKQDLVSVFPGTIYMGLPFRRLTLKSVFNHIPALIPTVFYTDDVLETKTDAARQHHAVLVAKIRQRLAKYVESIPAATFAQSPVPGAARRHAAFLSIIKDKNTLKNSMDLIEFYGFCYHHANFLTMPDTVLRPIGSIMHLSLPTFMPRSRLVQWADWILKDDNLIRQDGLRSLSNFELYEALLERGYLPQPQSPVRNLQMELADHLAFQSQLVEVAIRNRHRINGSKTSMSVAGKLDIPILTTRDIAAIGTVLALSRVFSK